MSTNPNDQAFGHGDMDHCHGLTIREYFAAMAMQGILTRRDTHYITIPHQGQAKESDDVGGIVFASVEVADALIAELNKEPKP